MCVFVCVCVCARMYVCVCVCTHVCVCVWVASETICSIQNFCGHGYTCLGKQIYMYALCTLSLTIISHHSTYPLSLTAWVVWAPQMTSQPISSIFLCSPLPSVTWQTPGLSIPWCCLPTSSCVCRIFFPLSVPCKMVLARPDDWRYVSYHCSLCLFTLQWSGGLHVV